MSLTSSNLLSARLRCVRRIGVAVTVAVGACALSVAPAHAESSTSSGEIAVSAGKAIAAWDRWETAGQMGDYAAYIEGRDETARIVAYWLEVPAASLRWAWSSVAIEKQHALLAALSQVGVPYRSRASKEGKGFDCSGLMLFAFHSAGIDLPRSSRSQINASVEVDASRAQAGDVLFYPGHISMFLGIGLIVHAPQTGMDVEVRHIFDRQVEFGDLVAADALGKLDPDA
jgi:cell wall-associated NlpC family hydrolase